MYFVNIPLCCRFSQLVHSINTAEDKIRQRSWINKGRNSHLAQLSAVALVVIDKLDCLKFDRVLLHARVPSTYTQGKYVQGSYNLRMGFYRNHQDLSKVFSHVHSIQVYNRALANANFFHFLCPCDAQHLPKYGSFGHPFKRTPLWVHSIRKCLTSSFDRSPTVLKKKKKAHEKKQWTDNSLTN